MSGEYLIYAHNFPNGKKYIGITRNAEKRWKNGEGYKSQSKIYNAIQSYGWENIEHEILVSGLEKEQAEKLEQILIQAYDSIEDGYNTAIGGQNINSSYLNEHVLYMLRESKKFDEKYGYTQEEDSVMAYVESAKYDKKLAETINYYDILIENQYDEYKRYAGCNIAHDLGEARVDCYWWTMMRLLANNLPNSETPYWDAWREECLKNSL